MDVTRPLRQLVRRTLIARGYDIVRPTYGVHANPLDAQRHLVEAAAPVILDVGANVGQSAATYLGAFPQARVFSFEPFPGTFALLKARQAELPGLTAVPLAVAERPGQRTFYANERSSTSSLLPIAARAARHVKAELLRPQAAISVECTTIDAFCAEHQLAHVDILKLDIQGGEGDALKGAAGMLTGSQITAVYTEVNFVELYEGQADFCAIDGLLRAHGYALYGLFDLNYGRSGLLAWADALYVSPGRAASLPTA